MQATPTRQDPSNERVELTTDTVNSDCHGGLDVEEAEGFISRTPQRQATPQDHDLTTSLRSNVSTANPNF